MSIETKKIEYLPFIVREYNLILKKKSKMPRSKRDKMQSIAEALVKKGNIQIADNGEASLRITFNKL
jgi:hypothetical protein